MVNALYIYPVKSLGGSYKTTWKATPSGFEYDRTWMLIDKNNRFITQREFPQLSTFSSDISEGQVHVFKGEEKFFWETNRKEIKQLQTKVWDDIAYVQEVDKGVDRFFSDLLGAHVRLVKQSQKDERQHFDVKLNKNIPVSLADGYPYLCIGSRSMDILNSKLEFPVSIDRFRPNIVLETITAHEEDDYGKIIIGEVPFLNMKPCARCMVVNINQQTSKSEKEPLATLNAYRKTNNKIFFGTNLMCTEEGYISVGEKCTHLK
ncbi:MAG: MOSC domain-containing protein [Saprospiraceae bacterium]|nr:MOSC domain-containing protein [Saprospiraceae bacterium]